MPADLLPATEAAKEFLAKSGYPFARLDKAELKDIQRQWRLVFDVGVAKPLLKTVVLDSESGKVIGVE